MSDGLTDVVGHLEALAPMVIVRPKSGDDVEIDPADVVSVRELSHRPVRNSEIRALEHAAALAGAGRRWMGPRTLRALNAVAGIVFFGFALRLAWKFLQTYR